MKTSTLAISLILFVLCTSTLGANKKNKPKDWGEMTTKSLDYSYKDKLGYFTTSMEFTYNGDSKNDKTQKVDMVVDFSTNHIIVGNKKPAAGKSAFDWGLDCSKENDHCTEVAGEATTDKYLGKYAYTFMKYNTVASMFEGVNLKDSKVGLKIRMCENMNSYQIPFDKNGILGLGP